MEELFSEILPGDLGRHAVWVLLEDETLAKSVDSREQIEDELVIVRTDFEDPLRNRYIGYLFWGAPPSIDYSRPVMFLDEMANKGISFWRGVVQPDAHWFDEVRDVLSARSFPLHYRSVPAFGLDR